MELLPTFYLVISINTKYIEDDSKSYGQTEFRSNQSLQSVFSQQMIIMIN